jgi:serine/threonine protein kinase
MASRLQVKCPSCGQSYGGEAGTLMGRSFVCKKCGASFQVTASGAVALPPDKTATGRPSAFSSSTAGGGRPPAPTGAGAAAGAGAGRPTVVGSYEIRRVLGQGAFGVVYLAHHPFLNIEVAIKLLRAEALASREAVERFLREAQVLARMQHPNVLRVFDAGKHGSEYYIAAAYLPGKDLAKGIPEGGMDVGRAVRLTIQVLRALEYAHAQGVIHRDIKPQNLRLKDDDTLVVMDFGLAGWTEVATQGGDPTKLTRAGAIMGTPAYMAPEQVTGVTDEKTDLYSAGVVLYELLTGQVPFHGATSIPALLSAIIAVEPPPASSLRPDLDPELAAISRKAMSKQPEQRFRSAGEFADTLEAWLNGPTLVSAPTPIPVSLPDPVPVPVPVPVPGPLPVPVPLSPTSGGPDHTRHWIVVGILSVVAVTILAVAWMVVSARKNTTEADHPKGFWKERDEYAH